MNNPTFEFKHAVTRRPSISSIDGLRAVDIGAPDLARMQAAHDAYIATLRETGAQVVELAALEAFPDSVFVEDTALCLPEGAILMRPGAPSRVGEVAEMAPFLRSHFQNVREITGPGRIEGGDILTTSKEILVGLSDRTDQAGIDELADLVAEWNYAVRTVTVPEGVLHFKTDCSVLDERTILATQRLETSGCFSDYNVIHTCDGEEAAANAIRFNQFVIMPANFPNTAKRLRDGGFDVREIDNAECAKLDGGMSCLSLRF